MEKAEISDGHSTVGHVVEDDVAAAPDSAEDAATAMDEAVTGDGVNSGQAGSVDNSDGGDESAVDGQRCTAGYRRGHPGRGIVCAGIKV